MAQTPDINGNWVITEGKYGDGSYDGTVTMQNSPSICRLHWNAGGAEYDGFGWLIGKTLYAAWGQVERFGYVLYTIEDDSVLTGVWGISTDPTNAGNERASGGSLSKKNTTFVVNGTNPDRTIYTGKLEIAHEGEVYHLVWHVKDDVFYGDGIRVGNTLIVGWGGASDVFGAVFYNVNPAGTEARGRFVSHGGSSVGTENLARPSHGGRPGR